MRVCNTCDGCDFKLDKINVSKTFAKLIVECLQEERSVLQHGRHISLDPERGCDKGSHVVR